MLTLQDAFVYVVFLGLVTIWLEIKSQGGD